MSRYHHSQKAHLIRAVFAATGGVAVLIALLNSDPVGWMIVGALLAFLMFLGWLFSSLTVEVTDDEITWFFGPGFWRKRLARAEVERAAEVGTQCWYGWGIRYTPQGWMYNVSGLKAVKLTKRSGKTILIGTDEPAALLAALRTD